MKPSFENVKYGQLVEVLNKDGYHAGMKIHFFNQKGVFVGNIYQFKPYDSIRFRDSNHFEIVSKSPLKQFIYKSACTIATHLIRYTQKISK